MRAASAVGIHDNFAPGKTGVGLRAADDKFARGVNVNFGVLINPFFDGGNNGRGFNFFLGFFGDFGTRSIQNIFRVLGGNDHRVHAHGFAVYIFHGYLALGVRAQVRQHFGAAGLF